MEFTMKLSDISISNDIKNNKIIINMFYKDQLNNINSLNSSSEQYFNIDFIDDNILTISLTYIQFLDLFHKISNNTNYLDLLNKMYDFYEFTHTVNSVPIVNFSIFDKDLSYGTIIPNKIRGSDVGFDVTLIREIKRDGNMIMYGSNVCVQPPLGYYTELVPRSSIYKSGYIQANSVGIIDSNYTGELCTVLCKINPDKPDIQLPFRYGQLILKKYELCITKVKETLEKTSRGSGGFGSTG